MEINSRTSLYFPGLNGVRFAAALLVIVSHSFVFSSNLGYPEWGGHEFSTHLGASGVSIFFTLSGFLLTSLLLREKEVTSTVGISAFYMRRILRIWPLYFLFLGISFFLLPEIPFFETEVTGWNEGTTYLKELLLYVCLLPNVAFVWLPLIPYTHVLWSIGVEEQFYLFWPHVIRRINLRRLPGFMLGLMAALLLLKLILVGINYGTQGQHGLHHVVQFLDRTRFPCMIVGGCYAWLLTTQSSWLKLLFRKWAQWISLLLMTALVLYAAGVPVFDQELISLFAGIVILNIAANPKPIFRLNSRWMDYLGRISYGLYIWHGPVLVVCLRACEKFLPKTSPHGWLGTLLVLVCTLLLTTGVATLSYYGFERVFTRMKRRYSVIASGDDAQPGRNKGTSKNP